MIARLAGRHSLRAAAVCALGLTTVFALACEKVPLLAPSGSTITLTTAVNALSVNGTAEIVAQVIEPAGTPPHSGTHVIFTTTLGRIEPSEAETDINGRAVVRFVSGGANGTALISASSGAASTGTNGALRILVGTAAVGRVNMNASPATVPSTGGSTTITANVVDINGNILTATPVSFTTTAGSLSSTLAATDANGNASVVLTTGQQAVVTATVGAQGTTPGTGTGDGSGSGGTPGTGTTPSGQASAQVTVRVAAAPQVVIKPPAEPPSVGLPAIFTFDVTVAAEGGSAVRDLTVNWGDGRTDSFGAVTGSQTAAHVYNAAGSYIVRAIVTDASGNVTSVSTSVSVVPVPRPSIIVTPTPQSAPAGSTISFRIEIDVPTGVAVQSAIIDFGDGFSQSLGGASGIVTVTHRYPTVGTYTVTVTVTDSTGQTTSGNTIVTITS